MSAVKWVLSPQLWAVRTCVTVAFLIMLWSDNMEATDMILSLPAEYFPIALVECALIALLITAVASYGSFKAQDKEVARASGGALAYGMNYLSANIGVVIVAAILGPVLSGAYYQAAGVDPTLWGVFGICFIVGVCVGLGGEKLIKTFLEGVRDSAKADEARAEYAATQTETKN